DLQVRAEGDMFRALCHLASLVDPGDRYRERSNEQARDDPVRPRRSALVVGQCDEEQQEADLAEQLDALRQTRQQAPLMYGGDVRQERRVRIDRGIEEDREEEDRNGECDE